MAYLIDFKDNWDDPLPLIELSYNNSYYSRILVAQLDTLYVRRNRSLIGWSKVDKVYLIVYLIGPELV